VRREEESARKQSAGRGQEAEVGRWQMAVFHRQKEA